MGRDNRDKWRFIEHPSKKTIEAEEARYWKNILPKLLKIGLEFEYNLPDKNGTCKGDNNACPCVHMKTSDCWRECIREEECKAAKGEDFTCFGLFCTGFVSRCVSCPEFTVDCKSCEHRYDPEKNPDAIRERMGKELMPSNSYGTVTKYGVHQIAQDGSLLGKKGIEIITTGRRVDFWEFYRMSKEIIDKAAANNAYLNERCSIHAHLLTSYYGKIANNSNDGGPGVPAHINEMERDMPEIVLANFHQLCRRYQNAMTWMSMGLDRMQHLTRWEKFRVSILEISAIKNSMSGVQELVAEHSSTTNGGGPNKYGWANYNNCAFSKNGDVNRFHVEMRVMDGLMSPSAVTAMSCLFYSLLIKAVEISRYGVLEVGNEGWLKKARTVKETILNNTAPYDKGDRLGHTNGLKEHFDYLIGESLDLISQVKHILMKLGPAYDVLEKLAERPCALRRCDGHSWEEIENDLAVSMTKEDMIAAKLAEIIDKRYVDQCQNEEEWALQAAEIIREDKEIAVDPDDATLEERIRTYIEKKRCDGQMVWLDRIGTMATV